MDAEMVSDLLDNDRTYQDFPKHLFIQKLENAFYVFERKGDTHLFVYPGTCASTTCFIGAKGRRFVGNHSCWYMDFFTDSLFLCFTVSPFFPILHRMRKILTSVMLLILAFNWLGYDLVVSLMSRKVELEANHRIEAGNYQTQQLIEIKVDLELPYATDWTTFERIQGAVTYQGVVYNFVERKYENGQMVYRCLPNQRGTELQNARDYFYSLVYDMESQEKQDHGPKELTVKKLSIETIVTPTPTYAFLQPHLPATQVLWLKKASMNGFGFIPSEPPEVSMNVKAS